MYADEGLVAEVDAAGNVIKSYGYKPGSTWTTDPLFMHTGGQYYFYQNDLLGTPQKLTAVNGAVVWSAKYSSFGKADVDLSSAITNNLRFAGQYFDQETELHYNWHRYYDLNTGRYLSVDMYGIGNGFNHLYLYSKSNPITYIDPAGLKCKLSFTLILKFGWDKETKWGEWGEWYLSNFNTHDGGKGPIFWFNARCICKRKKSGQKITNINVYKKKYYPN